MTVSTVRRAAVVAVVVLACLPAATVAATPAPPTAAALRPLRLAVDWPVSGATATVEPGAQLTVGVRPTGRAAPSRRAAVARVSLVRLATSAIPGRTIVSKQLRRGRVAIAIPTTREVTYVLRLRAGRRRFESRLSVPAAPAPAPAPTPAPAPDLPRSPILPAPTPPGCDTGRVAYSASSQGTRSEPGGQARLAVTNTGEVCLGYTWGMWVQRRAADGTWEPFWPQGGWLGAMYVLLPGESVTFTWPIPADAADGLYRLVVPNLRPEDRSAQIEVEPLMFQVGPASPSDPPVPD